MNNFTNSPNLKSSEQNQNESLRPKYSHQPLTFDHFGTHVRIHENGKVTITCVSKESDEFDEVEVSASLIFLIAKQLKLTQQVEQIC